jgi:hypothetical protein
MPIIPVAAVLIDGASDDLPSYATPDNLFGMAAAGRVSIPFEIAMPSGPSSM